MFHVEHGKPNKDLYKTRRVLYGTFMFQLELKFFVWHVEQRFRLSSRRLFR
nr:MAG TPA: hypothetical protein [Caudoviricetes sp.]DAH85982.1 MAG TPA: hypothetical protein [Caudoviricetes sp.]